MDLFRAAADLGDVDRGRYLDAACGSDVALRAEVESMLRYDKRLSDDFAESEMASVRGRFNAILDRDDEPAEDSPTPLPERIGRYRPIRIIGRGGMGIVYEAEQDSPKRRVALKMIRAGALSGQLLRRFRLEAELLGRLHHPGIAQVYDAGTIDAGEGGQPFFAMELIEGKPITDHARRNSLRTADRLQLFLQVCEAVQHAHQKGVLHRDIKPENILVDALGQARMLDFGVARATDADVQVTTIQTDAGTLIGTVPYMSPEQVTGRVDSIDTRSDVYALGVVLFELLADRLPYDLRGRSVIESARIIQEDEPTRLGSVATSLRGDLDAIVRRALEKDPSRRYQTAGEMATDVRRHLNSEPISARPPSTMYRVRRFARRNRALVIGTGATFAALTAGLVISFMFAMNARESALHAEWATYRAQMSRCAEALRRHDVVIAREAAESAPGRFDGWERRHFQTRLSPFILERVSHDTTAWQAPHWSVLSGPRAVRTRNGAVAVVDVLEDRVVGEFTVEYPLSSPMISADGSRLAAIESAKATIHVWSLDGAVHHTFRASPDLDVTIPNTNPEIVILASIDRDGSRLAYIGLDAAGTMLTVLDVASGRTLYTTPHDPRQAPVLSNDGLRLARPVSESLLIVDVATGNTLATRDLGARVWTAAWSDDDGLLCVPSPIRRTIHVLRGDDLDVLLETHPGVLEPLGAAFSRDGTTVAVARGRLVERWDIASRTLIEAIPAEATSVSFDPTGAHLLITSSQSIQIIDLDAAHPPVFADSTYLYLVAFSPDGSMLATGGFSGTVHLWDLVENRLAGSIATRGTIIISLSFLDDGSGISIVTRGDGTTPEFSEIWDTMTLEQRTAHPADWFMRAGSCAVTGVRGVGFAVSSDGTRAVAGRTLYYYGVAETAIIDRAGKREILIIQQEADVAAISRDNSMIAIEDPLGAAIFDARTGVRLRTLHLPLGDNLYGLAFTIDGSRLVGGARSGAIHFWDIATGDLICSLYEHDDYVHHVLFSDDGTMLATASGDGTARVFDSIPYGERERGRLAAQERRAARMNDIAHWVKGDVDRSKIADRLRIDPALSTADRRSLFDSCDRDSE